VFLGVSSPVVDMFVRGDVPREMRLLAARGLLTSVDIDRLALLALTTGDADPDVADLARATMAAIPAAVLSDFLSGDSVPPQLRAFFADQPAPVTATSAPTPVDDPGGAATPGAASASPEIGTAASAAIDLTDDAPSDTVVAALDDAVATLGDDGDEEQVHQLLTSLPVPDKIKLATLGRREQRAILIRDPNRIVSTAVLSSPKLTETEVEMFARMQNVSEEVLRIIGMSRVWVKSYNIVAALVKNPRTPTAVSLPLLPRLLERDVKGLTVNRNLPESVRLAARKFMAVQQERRGG
jgi:hypothetical protein